jgi:hypothetical protein
MNNPMRAHFFIWFPQSACPLQCPSVTSIVCPRWEFLPHLDVPRTDSGQCNVLQPCALPSSPPQLCSPLSHHLVVLLRRSLLSRLSLNTLACTTTRLFFHVITDRPRGYRSVRRRHIQPILPTSNC